MEMNQVEGGISQESNNWQRIPGLFNKRELEQMKEPGREYYQEPRGKDDWGQEVFVLYLRPQSNEINPNGMEEIHE